MTENLYEGHLRNLQKKYGEDNQAFIKYVAGLLENKDDKISEFSDEVKRLKTVLNEQYGSL